MQLFQALTLLIANIIIFLYNKVRQIANHIFRPNFSCLICYQTTEKQDKLCGFCNICSSCLDSWFAEQIKRQIENKVKSNIDPEINCSECKMSYSKEKIIQNQDKLQKTMSQMSLLYIQKSDQFIKCASKYCQNIGWVNNKNCEDEYNCPVCDHKWVADKGLSIFQRILQLFNIKEIKSKIYKTIFVKRCPHCNIYIEKNGGCNNMICKNCGKSFCWYCMIGQQHGITIFCLIIQVLNIFFWFRFPLKSLIKLNYNISKKLIIDFTQPISLLPLSIKLVAYYFLTISTFIFEKLLILITPNKVKQQSIKLE